jgi:hypothetical protein
MRINRIYGACTATLLLSAATALAQTTPELPLIENETTAATTVTPTTLASPYGSILSVSLPPNVRLRLDVNARDEDVLGIVKSFLRGFKGENLQSMLLSMSRVRASTNTGPTEGPASGDISKAAAVQLLSDADLETILKQINHARFVVFETANPYSGGSTSYQASRARATRAAHSTIAHYENAYITREGGRRIARGDFDDVQVLAVGFPGRGFALVIGAPGTGVVIRADGYPNFEGLGPLLMGMGLLVAPGMR